MSAMSKSQPAPLLFHSPQHVAYRVLIHCTSYKYHMVHINTCVRGWKANGLGQLCLSPLVKKKKCKLFPQILPLTLNRCSFIFLGLELDYMVTSEVKLGRFCGKQFFFFFFWCFHFSSCGPGIHIVLVLLGNEIASETLDSSQSSATRSVLPRIHHLLRLSVPIPQLHSCYTQSTPQMDSFPLIQLNSPSKHWDTIQFS